MELTRLAQEEKDLRFPVFDHDTAWSLGMFLRDRARESGLPLAIRIISHDRILFHCSLAGASQDNDTWASAKARVVRRFGHSSMYMMRLMEDRGKTFRGDYHINDRKYRAKGGAFPILSGDGLLLGIASVSGMSGEEDHSFITEGMKEWLKRRNG